MNRDRSRKTLAGTSTVLAAADEALLTEVEAEAEEERDADTAALCWKVDVLVLVLVVVLANDVDVVVVLCKAVEMMVLLSSTVLHPREVLEV